MNIASASKYNMRYFFIEFSTLTNKGTSVYGISRCIIINVFSMLFNDYFHTLHPYTNTFYDTICKNITTRWLPKTIFVCFCSIILLKEGCNISSRLVFFVILQRTIIPSKTWDLQYTNILFIMMIACNVS